MVDPDPGGRYILYFDGDCGLCSRLVRFVMERDVRRRFLFAPLQGSSARNELVPRGFDPGALSTLHLLIADRDVLVKSRAVFAILAELPAPWKALAFLRHLPGAFTDAAYDLVATVRYRIWGRADRCAMPSAESRRLFLD